MRHCLRFFIHDRKARLQPSRKGLEDKMNKSLDELPSYTDLFGYSETHSGHVQSLSPDKTLKKQPDIKSEVSTAKSKEVDPLDIATCTTILEEVSGRKQADGEYDTLDCGSSD